MLARDDQELIHPLLKSGRILLPQKIMKKDTHGIHAESLGPSEFAIDFRWIECGGLPHLQFVISVRRKIIRTHEPGLLRLPLPGTINGPPGVLSGAWKAKSESRSQNHD